ncbi:zinc finger protein Xfin-like isoform X2 [Aedes aegypti]|uniref:C2H2-type domain-containing protein n=1 Tax=Aedes aegypti TaxID=7159 RepID=A0A6I8TMI7_AEDAE|nr:zinc finger protein Xfin-like isoform X2 [Aedes aegypti]
MFCSYCKKSSHILFTHHLCGCCLGNLQCDHPKHTAAVALKDEALLKVQCAICHEEFPENELQQHQDACMPLLVFRCAVCGQDYLSKEGLWNHLDQHEIADDKKDLYYEEKASKHVLHKCAICNDQRGYQESLYWHHIHEDHDGFFLRCTECGDSFRSQKLETDHRLNHCEARKQAIPDEFKEVKFVPEFSEVNFPVEDAETSLNELPSDLLLIPQLQQFESLDPTDEVQENDNVQLDESSDVEGSMSETDESSVPKSGRTNATTCGVCKKSFNSPIRFYRHQDYAHRKRTCQLCRITVTGSNQYRYHMLKQHSEPSYKCAHCKKEFHLLAAYRRHTDTHANKFRYQCKISSTSAAVEEPSNDLQHANAVQPDASSCPICKMSFEDEEQLKIHEETGHSHLHYRCTHCPRRFQSRKDFDAHLREHDKSRDKKIVIATPTTCSECNKECYNVKRMTRHIDSCHAPMTCKDCKTVMYGRHKFQYHRMVCHTEPAFQCSHCLKKFHHAKSYKQHMNYHSKFELDFPEPTSSSQQAEVIDKKVEQDIQPTKSSNNKLQSMTWCVKCEKSIADLNRHNYFIHKPTACKICGIIFPGKQKTLNHEMEKHMAPKMKCPHCPKTFQKKLLLRRHLDHHLNYHWKYSKVDDNQEPTANHPSNLCTICGQTFANLIELRNHQIVKHTFSEEDQSKPLVNCKECDKGCDDEKSLQTHHRECHLPIECDICGATNAGKRRAVYHKLMKHSEPALQCPRCPKKFHLKLSLQRHVDAHIKRKEMTNHSLSESLGQTDSSDTVPTEELELPEHPNEDPIFVKYETPMDQEEESNDRSDQGTDFTNTVFVKEDPELQQYPVEEVPHLIKVEPNLSDQEADQTDRIKEGSASGNSNPTVSTSAMKNPPKCVMKQMKPAAGYVACTQCERHVLERNLTKHMTLLHKPITCTICGAIIIGQNQLMYHKLTKHSEPRLDCPHCEKKFYYKSMYQRHMKIHTKSAAS